MQPVTVTTEVFVAAVKASGLEVAISLKDAPRHATLFDVTLEGSGISEFTIQAPAKTGSPRSVQLDETVINALLTAGANRDVFARALPKGVATIIQATMRELSGEKQPSAKTPATSKKSAPVAANAPA